MLDSCEDGRICLARNGIVCTDACFTMIAWFSDNVIRISSSIHLLGPCWFKWFVTLPQNQPECLPAFDSFICVTPFEKNQCVWNELGWPLNPINIAWTA